MHDRSRRTSWQRSEIRRIESVPAAFDKESVPPRIDIFLVEYRVYSQLLVTGNEDVSTGTALPKELNDDTAQLPRQTRLGAEERHFPLRKNLAEETAHHPVELLRPLQRREMAHAGQEDKFRSGNAPGEIFGMFGFDKLIMLALHDRDGHTNIGQIAREIIRFRPLHLTDRIGKGLELVWSV